MPFLPVPGLQTGSPQNTAGINGDYWAFPYVEQAYFPAANGLRDVARNGRHLVNTAASFSPSLAGMSFKTAGNSSSYFAAPSAAISRFTIEAYYIPNATTNQYICGTQESPNNATHDRELWIDGSGKYTFYIHDGAVKKVVSTTSAAVNTPVHLQGISDGTNIYLYINGVLEATTAAGTAYAGYATPEFVVGTGQYDTGTAIWGSGWLVYAVRFSKAFSAAEARDRYLNKYDILQSPLRFLFFPGPAGGTTYNQSIDGSITFAGALTKQTNKAVAGSSTPAGALSKLTSKAFAGSLTGAGGLAKQTAKAFAGSVTGSGSLTTMILFTASMGGSITPSGAIAKMTIKALAGASTFAGAISKMTAKGLGGEVTLTGALSRLTAKAFAGSVTVAGSLAESYQVLKSLAGSITPTGALGAVYIAFVAGVLKLLALMGVGQ